MWFILLKVYVLKSFCIFAFVVLFIMAFLLIVYNTRTDELRQFIMPRKLCQPADVPQENRDHVDDKLEALTEKLTEKERMLQRSQCEIKNAERVLNDLESKTSTCRDRFRLLMTELKKDVRNTEDEVRLLRSQVSSLSCRREALKNELIKQQEDYQKMLNNFTKELENKKMLFSSNIEKARQPRVSYFGL